ncbi:mechanosensitive ion channel [Candidatus Gracilibacteria bacterium]|nr:mechanosensitive ion channel [Candidatus Gracilibacteria bacterium]
MTEQLSNFISGLNGIYVFIIILNLIIFIFAKWIVNFLDTSSLEKKKIGEKEKEKIKKKIIFIRINISLMLVAYIVTHIFKAEFLNDVILTLFIIILSYLINSWVFKRMLLFYGEEVEVSGEKYFRRDYKINIFSLIVNIVTTLFVIFAIFKVFEIDGILQSGGIIAGMLAFLGFTAPVWAPDLVAGISMLHHDEVEVGNVVRIDELNILAWVKNISLSEVKLIDLVCGYPIIIRPSKFREMKVENLSMGVAGKKIKVPQFIIANISYNQSLYEVEQVFFEAWENMIKSLAIDSVERKYFSEKATVSVDILEFGDYSVKYKFNYMISSPFYLIKAQTLLNPFLQEAQKKYKINFSTPQLVNLDK